MLRMLGRFSCCALQNVWTLEMHIALKTLLNDPIQQIRDVRLVCCLLNIYAQTYNTDDFVLGDGACDWRI